MDVKITTEAFSSMKDFAVVNLPSVFGADMGSIDFSEYMGSLKPDFLEGVEIEDMEMTGSITFKGDLEFDFKGTVKGTGTLLDDTEVHILVSKVFDQNVQVGVQFKIAGKWKQGNVINKKR